MQFLAGHQNTIEDYFATEESSPVKHEFFNGEIFAMAGASLAHNRICGNIFSELREKLEKTDCEVFTNDLRLKTPHGLYTYPDLMVICGGVKLSETDRLDTVLNPKVIFEILSDSTKEYDRQDKFAFYREIRSLREYFLVEQKRAEIERYSLTDAAKRNEKTAWENEVYRDIGDSVKISSLNLEISAAQIYAKIELIKKL